MPLSLNFTEYVTTMSALLEIEPETELYPNQTELFNQMVNYAELRIYRELDFLHTVMEATTSDVTPGTRTQTVPDDIIIVNSASIVSPASTAAASGTRNPLQRVSMQFLDFFWPVTSTQGLPRYWAMQDNETMVLAPTPDAAYRVCCQGIFRPEPLSASNTTTFITDNLPDLFVAASAVWGFGGMLMNFGAQSDNPEAVQSWENQYQQLRAGVDMENLRSKAWSAGWQPWSPSPGAKESRT